jgi:RND superfamily putative drug exporter
MWKPLLTIAVIVTILAFFGQYFLRADFSSADYRSLPAGTQSRVVSQDMVNNFPGKSSADPVQVVINTHDTSLSAATITQLQAYSKKLAALPGVTSVSSLVSLQPSLPPAAYATAFGPGGSPNVARAASTLVSGSYYLVNVSYNSNYDQSLAKDLVAKARAASHPSGWDVKTGGETASLVDLLTSLGHYSVYGAIFIALSLFSLLLIMLRSVVIPIQALFVNILSLSATFGILVWVFQEGHLQKLLDFTSVHSIDATQPVLIFGIAFGLSMDYSVFLLSRITEQYDHDQNTREAIAMGLQKTGTIITSAALLFIVVVGAFATSAIPLIKQIGIGLGLAVFLDAFVVRMLLVPAIMSLFGPYNWWPSRRHPKAKV